MVKVAQPCGSHGARVRPTDRGLLYGDGVFETVRTYGGTPFRLEAHWARLCASARFLGIRPPHVDPLRGVQEALDELGLRDAGVRITLTRGQEPPGPRPAPGTGTPTLLFHARPLRADLEDQARRGVPARRAPWPLRARGLPLHAHKTLCYLPSVLALGAVSPNEEAILLNTDGHVAEGATSNLFWVRGGVVFTPSVEAGCLPGLARALVVEEAPGLGLALEEGLYAVSDLAEAEEAFLTNSLVEVLPVTSLDDAPVGRALPGPVTRSFQHAYRRRVKAEVGR